MALPTLPSYLELKKVNFNQDFLKSKHSSEYDYRYLHNLIE